MHRLSFIVLFSMIAGMFGSDPALAFVQFQKQWVETYIDKEDDSDENKKYIKMVAKGKDRCLVCHQGKKRVHYNPYGEHFVGNLTEDDKKDKKKIAEWIATVGEMHSDPDDDESPTYDELIAAKKFPGGDVEDLRKPVEDSESEDEDDADDQGDGESLE